MAIVYLTIPSFVDFAVCMHLLKKMTGDQLSEF